MHILCLTDAFWHDHTGGISKSLRPEIDGLVRLGHDVTIFSKRLYSHSPFKEQHDGYTLYRYPGPDKHSAFYRLYPLFSIFNMPRFIRSMHRHHPFDVGYVHNPFQAVGLIRALPNLKYVYNYHASAANEIRIDSEHGKYGKLTFLTNLIIRWVNSIERKTVKHAHQVMVDSHFMGDNLCQLQPSMDKSKLIRIPLCVDTNKFFFSQKVTATRPKLGLPHNQFIIFTVRRLVARMGLENLITAMKIVTAKFPHVLLLIGGKGYLADDLQNQINNLNIKKSIRLLGFIPEEKLVHYYQASDIFVLPTLTYEGFGVVTIESLACGTPVIATPVGATPEILRPLNERLLFDDNTPESIANGMMYWLANPPNVEFRHECRAFCERNFSPDIICNMLDDVLHT
ncbi:MAG: hypothetical protein B6242_11695 [Anaerolineaceae bacterium 4572_78]|nr:MAG: hypothetical protein B6242_11695 [Anaerolineaceae bacterium 4572_78]